MRLKAIELTNFRLFRHPQRIEFEAVAGKPLTIIRAENRTGKTTLLIALQWCLYGEKAVFEARQMLAGSSNIVSIAALEAASPEDNVETTVSVEFDHEGEQYMAQRRRITVRGKDVQSSEPSGEDVFAVVRMSPTGAEDKPNPETFMNQILSFHLRELFFFDGDRINAFMQPDHEAAVEAAITDMLEFELFEQAQKDLRELRDSYRAKIRQTASGQSASLRDKESEVEAHLSEAQADVARLADQLKAEEQIRQTLVEELAGVPGDAGELQKQINRAGEQIKGLEAANQTIAADLAKQIASGTYFTMPALLAAGQQLLAQKKKAGEIPRRIGEDLINERLELQECICGRPLVPGEEPHEHLTSMLSTQRERAVVEEAAIAVLYFLNAFARRSKQELAEQMDDLVRQRDQHRETIRSNAALITELKGKLGEIPIDYVQGLKQSLNDVFNRIQRLTLERSTRERRAEDLAKDLESATRQRRQSEQKEQQTAVLRKRERLAEECFKALTLTYQSVREIERRKVSERTAENFSRMNIRQDEFGSVEVTPSFKLEVRAARTGTLMNAELSGAQRRALSLSFLFALMEVAERDAPVVVDTPLGMTSGEMKRSITKTMLDETHQLILLLTRSEISGVEDVLAEGAARQLTLTCSMDYPEELVHAPILEGAYTQVCDSKIDEECEICARKPFAVEPAGATS